ncbi:hypothetical protein RB195_019898 [Necator americanus]|uniref:Uncharacterized protein n=1 Tax=Necator americanus TaxID=51031 RepID=A0ABR1CIH2_NECAM
MGGWLGPSTNFHEPHAINPANLQLAPGLNEGPSAQKSAVRPSRRSGEMHNRDARESAKIVPRAPKTVLNCKMAFPFEKAIVSSLEFITRTSNDGDTSRGGLPRLYSLLLTMFYYQDGTVPQLRCTNSSEPNGTQKSDEFLLVKQSRAPLMER